MNLRDEAVTWGARRAFTFVVGDDGVVGPNLSVSKNRDTFTKRRSVTKRSGRIAAQVSDRATSSNITVSRSARNTSVVEDQKLGPVSEREVNSHLIHRLK